MTAAGMVRLKPDATTKTAGKGNVVSGFSRTLLAACVLSASLASAQSLSYSSGQNVSPAYEGWEQAADGTHGRQ
ncbi:MAG: hypothetical protein Q8N52_01850, partial [Acidobacteriota bacterium]|nr:hypothetical protein [Acidobacteriota bacterium]